MIITKHALGDAVFTADNYGFRKDIVRSIKITGDNEEKYNIFYGCDYGKATAMLASWMGRDNLWFAERNVFKTAAAAEKRHKELKRIVDEKDRIEAAARIEKRKAELKAELEELSDE